MNRKTLVIFFAMLLVSFLIFILTFNSKLDYLALGDELALGITPYNEYNKSYTDFFKNYLNNKNKLKTYIIEFNKKDYKINDAIEDIKNSKELSINSKKINITQAIVSSDIITISLGQKDIYNLLYSNYKNNKVTSKKSIYDGVDEIFNSYVELLNIIRKINDCKIYIIGFYNPLINVEQKNISDIEEIFSYMNKKFKSLEENNKNIYYIKLSDTMDNKNYYIPNYKNPYPSIEGYNYISNQIICKMEKKCWFFKIFCV